MISKNFDYIAIIIYLYVADLHMWYIIIYLNDIKSYSASVILSNKTQYLLNV